MKLWWLLGLCTMTMIAVPRSTNAGTQPVKDASGKTIAVVVTCDSCQSRDASKKGCSSGVEHGWLNGVPCGRCMLDENAGQPLGYAYDLHLTGKLANADGAPSKQRFVKLYLSNGWTVRTRTSDDGAFRLMLGATQDRKTKKPLVVDLGTQVDASNATADYALYFLPDNYKPCPPDAATSEKPKVAPATRKNKPAKK